MVRRERHAPGDDSAPSNADSADVLGARSLTVADAFVNIIGATASLLGSTFLTQVVLHTALELDVDYAIVWESIDATLVRIVAASDPALVGHVQESAKTPCGEILRDGTSLLYGDHVAKRFPEDEWIVEQHVRGFLGVPLTATDGKIIGALSVATRTPIHENLNIETTLRALVPRIAGELERLQLETKLRRYEEDFKRESLLQSVMDALPDMIFRIDGSGIYRDFIPAAGTSPLVPPDAFLGRNVAEIMPEEVAVAGLRAIRLALERGESQRMGYSLSIEGKLRYREARIVPIGDDEVLAFVRDVTEQYLPVRGGRGQQRRALTGALDANYQIPYGLTLREVGVLRYVARGMADKEIAEALGISPYTVNKHVATILSKMGVPSRTAAGVNAVREGILMNDLDAPGW